MKRTTQTREEDRKEIAFALEHPVRGDLATLVCERVSKELPLYFHCAFPTNLDDAYFVARNISTARQVFAPIIDIALVNARSTSSAQAYCSQNTRKAPTGLHAYFDNFATIGEQFAKHDHIYFGSGTILLNTPLLKQNKYALARAIGRGIFSSTDHNGVPCIMSPDWEDIAARKPDEVLCYQHDNKIDIIVEKERAKHVHSRV